KDMRYAAIAGACMIGATQATNFLVGFIPLTIVWLLVRWRAWRPTLVAAGVIGSVAVLTLAPWVARNYSLFNRIVPFSTDNGAGFYKNNNPFILDLVQRNLGPDYAGP